MACGVTRSSWRLRTTPVTRSCRNSSTNFLPQLRSHWRSSAARVRGRPELPSERPLERDDHGSPLCWEAAGRRRSSCTQRANAAGPRVRTGTASPCSEGALRRRAFEAKALARFGGRKHPSPEQLNNLAGPLNQTAIRRQDSLFKIQVVLEANPHVAAQ